eukprot:107658-Chlamydomonas_euryale.AAC.13
MAGSPAGLGGTSAGPATAGEVLWQMAVDIFWVWHWAALRQGGLGRTQLCCGSDEVGCSPVAVATGQSTTQLHQQMDEKRPNKCGQEQDTYLPPERPPLTNWLLQHQQ